MVQDIRLGIRALADHKGFALAAVLTFALGIGANAAIFSVVYGVLLRPLPYPGPDRLVRLAEFHPGANAPIQGSWLSNLTYHAWRPGARTIGPIAVFGSRTFTVGFDDTSRIRGSVASPELFDVLRVAPQLGRVFSPSDAADGAAPVAILSDGLWRERFGGDRAAIGRSIDIEGRRHQIIGVMQSGFAFPEREVRLWTPTSVGPLGAGPNPRVNILSAIARLEPGVSAEQAATEGTAAARRDPRPFTAEMMFGKGGPVEVRVRTLIDETTADIRPALLVLMGGVGCLLLIACANVANLFLSRGVSRERELAIRIAIGANISRLVRQLLSESVVIAVAGGAIGLALAAALMQVLPAVAPEDFPRLDAVQLDWRVTTFALVASILSGILAGLVPALRGARPDLLPSLREGAGASSGVGTARFRRALLAAEAATAVMLLIGSALLVRSFVSLVHVDPGYDAANVLVSRIYLPGAAAGRADTPAFVGELLARLRAVPGVEAVGAGNMAPLGDSTYVSGFTLRAAGREPVTARGLAYCVTPGYAEALNLRLRSGRLLEERDVTSPLQAMVVNEEFVRTFLPGVSPVGMQIPSLLSAKATAEIVGVVANTLKDGLTTAPQPELYIAPAHGYSMRREINLVLRSHGDPVAHADTIRQIVRDIRRDAAVENVGTLAAQISTSVGNPRFAAAVLAGFAALALLLAAVGLYGVLSYTVSRRRREIGVRSALGASRASIVQLIFREGLSVVVIGLVIGVVAATAAARLMTTLLFGVTALDPTSFLIAPAILFVVALLACVVPARRAATIDPVIALRAE